MKTALLSVLLAGMIGCGPCEETAMPVWDHRTPQQVGQASKGMDYVHDLCNKKYDDLSQWMACEDAKNLAEGCVLDKAQTDRANATDGFDNNRFYICP